MRCLVKFKNSSTRFSTEFPFPEALRARKPIVYKGFRYNIQHVVEGKRLYWCCTRRCNGVKCPAKFSCDISGENFDDRQLNHNHSSETRYEAQRSQFTRLCGCRSAAVEHATDQDEPTSAPPPLSVPSTGENADTSNNRTQRPAAAKAAERTKEMIRMNDDSLSEDGDPEYEMEASIGEDKSEDGFDGDNGQLRVSIFF